MRRPLKRSIRNGLMLVAAVAALAASAMLARSFALPTVLPAKRVVFDYAQKAALDYKVNLRSSPLYEGSALGPGLAYFLDLVKNIDLRASYSLVTTPPAMVKCAYRLVGILNVYDAPGKDAVVIWSKQYNLVPSTECLADSGKIELNKDLVVDLGSYSPMIDLIYQQTEVRPARATLTLEWQVQASAEDGIQFAEPVTTTLVVPVGAKYFTVGGEPIGHKEGSYVVSDQTANVKAVSERRIWGTALGVSLSIALFLTLFTSVSKAERQTRALRATLNRLGSRVARSGTMEPIGRQVIDMATIDDLARVADELGKPIIYIPGNGISRADLFYVVDGDNRYQYAARP